MTLLTVLLLSLSAQVQTAIDPSGRSTVRVTGEATINAKPDRAEIDVSVVSQAKTAAAAAKENATKIDRTTNAIKNAFGTSVTLATISYEAYPMRRDNPKGSPFIDGYMVTNHLRATTNDLTVVGKVVDLAVASGANQVDRLAFTVKDETKVQSDALRAASHNAREKATAVAAGLGLRVVRVLNVEEASPTMRPVMYQKMRAMDGAAESAPTSIEAGNVQVQAMVNVVFEVVPGK